MSSSIVTHGFGVRKYRELKTEHTAGQVILHLEKQPQHQRCADCGSSHVIRKGQELRRIRTLPIGRREVFLELHLHRLLCRRCGALKLEPLLVSFPRKSWTKTLGRYVLELVQRMTIEDVAEHLHMSWDTIKEIHRWALDRKFKKRRIKHLRRLAVDEVAVRKGHRYLTIVLDLDSGEVVWVCEGRESQSLEPFLKRLRRAGVPIEAIAMDMWPAYLHAVAQYFSSQVIVFDRYHVIADYNKMLDQLRCDEAAAAARADKPLYKGTRYLLLTGQENLANRQGAKDKVNRLLQLNHSLSVAYILKEELREFWSCPDRLAAEAYLASWLHEASTSGIALLIKFANKLAAHRSGLLNYFDHPITTAKVEGTNNKIKVLKRRAYGYRDIGYFKLRIYFIHQARYALTG